MLTGSLTRGAVFDEVRCQLARILANKARDPAALVEPSAITEAVTFSDLRVSSLDLAELVSNLETAFEVDPFAERVAITSLRTVGDLCDAYLSCAEPLPGGGDALDSELKAVRARLLEGRRR